MFKSFLKQSSVINQKPKAILKRFMPKQISSTASASASESTDLKEPTMKFLAEVAAKRLFVAAVRTLAGFTYNQLMKDFRRTEGPKRYTLMPWRPIFHYQEVDQDKHLLICFLPGLTPKDVRLSYEGGIVHVQGSKKGELWTNGDCIYYKGSFKFPKKVREEKNVVFFIRMELGVLKMVLDKDGEGGIGSYKKSEEVAGEEFVLGDFPGIVF